MAYDARTTTEDSNQILTAWTPKVCKTMTSCATFKGFGLWFYIFWAPGVEATGIGLSSKAKAQRKMANLRTGPCSNVLESPATQHMTCSPTNLKASFFIL